MKRATLKINVGGTHYETSYSTIQSRPGTMLDMLLSRHVEGEEIFIDRDGEMFRWILYWYRTGIIVDYKIVGIPIDLWNAELDYYQVRLEKDADNDYEMTDKKRRILSDVEQAREKINDKEEENRKSRYIAYQNIVTYMIDNSGGQRSNTFEFIGALKKNVYDVNYPLNIRYTTMSFLKVCFYSEFKSFCQELGLNVKLVWYRENSMGKASYPPGRNSSFPYKHDSITIECSFI